MDRIIHLGRGKIATTQKGVFEDPTFARPRKGARLQDLATRGRQAALAARQAPRTKAVQYEPGPLTELASDQCRFHLDGDLYCGAKTVPEKSWCKDHIGIVYGRAM